MKLCFKKAGLHSGGAADLTEHLILSLHFFAKPTAACNIVAINTETGFNPRRADGPGKMLTPSWSKHQAIIPQHRRRASKGFPVDFGIIAFVFCRSIGD